MIVPTVATSTPPVLAALRTGTSAQHEALESELDLLREPLDAERFAVVLERFLGFHLAWEPALESTLGDEYRLSGRSRIALIRDDLRALGRSEAELAAVPVCEAARDLMREAAHAAGSVYVLEGSTLGGQVISRRLRDLPWVPQQGLRYFDPYGPHTGAMWKQTREQLAEAADRHGIAPIVEGALATFELLRRWLAAPVPAPVQA